MSITSITGAERFTMSIGLTPAMPATRIKPPHRGGTQTTEGTADDGDVSEGRNRHAEFRCMRCHGFVEGEGRGVA